MIKIYYFFKLLFSKIRKLELGSGKYQFDAWLKTDINTLDITDQHSWKKSFLFLRFDNVFSEHVWEHIESEESKLALENCFIFLKKGGRIRIAVPDGFHPDPDYLEHVKPGGTGPGANDHKILYNYYSLSKALKEAGFEVILLEFWDENGKFHFYEWDSSMGDVRRSSQNDRRNAKGKLNYTSLIIDGIKP